MKNNIDVNQLCETFKRKTVQYCRQLAFKLSRLCQQCSSSLDRYASNHQQNISDDQNGDIDDDHEPRIPLISTDGSADNDCQMQTRELIAGVWRLDPILPVVMPHQPWQPGVATHTGPIRERNEDYCLAFHVGDVAVAIVADGCGGVPYGQQAAHVGARGAAVSVIRQLAWLAEDQPGPSLEAVALQSIDDASESIAGYAGKFGINTDHAMRSTLIVLLVTDDRIHYAYIGDGGGYVFHTDDATVEPLVIPQKAGPYQNLLAASLGAAIEGQPQSGTLKRRQGDLIWICSDGIADRTAPEIFAGELAQAAIANGGDISTVAQSFVDQFAQYQDEAGYVFDDNMALVVMGDESIGGGYTSDIPVKVLESSVSTNPEPSLQSSEVITR